MIFTNTVTMLLDHIRDYLVVIYWNLRRNSNIETITYYDSILLFSLYVHNLWSYGGSLWF